MFIKLILLISLINLIVDAQIINSFMNRRPVQCRSFNGELGDCRSAVNCPWVRWDIQKQRQYACFRNILTIGVCCPNKKMSPSMDVNDLNQQKPIKIKIKPDLSSNFMNSTSNLFNRPFQELKNSTTNKFPFQTSLIQSNKIKNTQKPVITISISAYTPYMNTTTTSNSSLSLALNSTGDADLLNLSTLPQLNEALLNATILAIKKSYQTADKSVSNESHEEIDNTIYMKVINDFNQNSSPTSKQTMNGKTHECGIINQNYRIVGGHAASEGQWPWMAAIFLERQINSNKKEFWCGGALISDQYILSAAHCLTDLRGLKYLPSQLKIRLGTNWIERNQSDNLVKPPLNAYQYLQEFDVDHVRIHDHFQRNGFLNDIALIKLNKKVELNERVKCICLPTERNKLTDFSGLLATVLGWGSMKYGGIGSNQLQEVNLPIWKNEQCDQRFIQKINRKFLCAGYVSGLKDACQGDSGSPMILKDSNHIWRVQGIVSWGNKCAEPLYPGVYTRVAEFLDWIQYNMI